MGGWGVVLKKMLHSEMHVWFVITIICWIIVKGSTGCFLAAIDAYTMPRWAKLLFLWYSFFSFSFCCFYGFNCWVREKMWYACMFGVVGWAEWPSGLRL